MEIQFLDIDVLKIFITAFVSAAGGAMFGFAKNKNKEYELLKESVKALLRTDIINYHKEFVIEKKYCPIGMKFIIQECFKAYEDLDGNGTAREMFLEIEALPTEPPVDLDGWQ